MSFLLSAGLALDLPLPSQSDNRSGPIVFCTDVGKFTDQYPLRLLGAYFILALGVALSLYSSSIASKEAGCFSDETVQEEKDKKQRDTETSGWSSSNDMPTYKAAKSAKLALLIRCVQILRCLCFCIMIVYRCSLFVAAAK